MTITKSFQFDAKSEDDRGKVVAAVGDEEFTLVNDLTGFELMEALATFTSSASRGTVVFLRRVVRDEDWERFNKATMGATPSAMFGMANDLMDAYASFPTTPVGASSDGAQSTGSTPE